MTDDYFTNILTLQLFTMNIIKEIINKSYLKCQVAKLGIFKLKIKVIERKSLNLREETCYLKLEFVL